MDVLKLQDNAANTLEPTYQSYNHMAICE